MERVSLLGAMAARKISPAVYALMVVVAAATTAHLVSAQGQQGLPFCAVDLDGCLAYLNSTSNVPNRETCCNRLREVAGNANEVPCLCALVKDTQFVQQRNIDTTRALGLPLKCGAGFTISGCAADSQSPPAPPPDVALPPSGQAPASSPPVTLSPPSDQPPPEPSIASSPGDGGNPAAAPIAGNAWTGLPRLTACFLSGALFWLCA